MGESETLTSAPEPKRDDKLSTFGTMMNFLKMIFGFGTFVLPLSTFASGWLFGIIGFAAGCFLMIWTAIVLSYIEDKFRKLKKDNTTKFSYPSLTGAILGSNGTIFMQVLLVVTIFLVVAFYFSSISSMLELNKLTKFKNCSYVYIAVFASLSFGLSFIESNRLVSFASMFGMGSVALSIFLILIAGFSKDSILNSLTQPGLKESYIGAASLKTIVFNFSLNNDIVINAIFLLCLSLCCIEFKQDLINPKRNYKTAVSLSITIATVFNLIFSLACAYLYRDSLSFVLDVMGNKVSYQDAYKENDSKVVDMIIVNHIPNTWKATKIIATVTLSLNLLFSIMLLMKFPVNIVKEVMKKALDKLDSKTRAMALIGIKFVFVLGTCLAAMFSGQKGLSMFLGLIGAVCFPILAFILPALFLNKLGNLDFQEKIVMVLYLILGTYFITVGLSAVIAGIVNN